MLNGVREDLSIYNIHKLPFPSVNIEAKFLVNNNW